MTTTWENKKAESPHIVETPPITEGSQGDSPGGAMTPITQNNANPAYASFMRRFGAYFLDSILLLTFTFVAMVVAFKQSQTTFMSLNNLESTIWLIYALHLSATLGYFTLLIGNGGVTLGKWIMGIKVINVDGSQPTYGKAFVRAIGYLISAFFLYIGFLVMLLDSHSQTLHDKISGTYVVEIN